MLTILGAQVLEEFSMLIVFRIPSTLGPNSFFPFHIIEGVTARQAIALVMLQVVNMEAKSDEMKSLYIALDIPLVLDFHS